MALKSRRLYSKFAVTLVLFYEQSVALLREFVYRWMSNNENLLCQAGQCQMALTETELRLRVGSLGAAPL